MQGSTLRRLAFAGFASAQLSMLAGGLWYATTRTMLGYHREALGQSGQELTPAFQSLYLLMCRAIGVPTLLLALALLALLLIPWRRGELWALWAVPVLTLGYSLAMLGVTLWVHWRTGAHTPYVLLAIGSGITALSALLSRFATRVEPRSAREFR